MLDNNESIATAAKFVPLSEGQVADELSKFEEATS
jgi:hypothetical protein